MPPTPEPTSRPRPEKRRARRGRVLFGAFVLLAVLVPSFVYALSYIRARQVHRLVRYESGCVARGGLEGHARDYWGWEFQCPELRRYLGPNDEERTFARLIELEEAVRAPSKRRPSVCTIPAIGFPSQGISRPAWCD